MPEIDVTVFFGRVTKRVVDEMGTYTNWDSVSEEEREATRAAITDIAFILLAIKPDATEDEVFNSASELVYGSLEIKRRRQKLLANLRNNP